jgi:MFS family permease
MAQGRLGLLGRNRNYRYLWTARTLSFLGDMLTTVALVLYAASLENAAASVGLLLLAQTLPRLFGPFAGVIVDRIDQRRLMMMCECGQALLVGLIAFTSPPFPLLMLLVFGTTVLATLFGPAGRSTIPVLVAPSDIPTANATLSSGLNLALALGPGIGGLLVGSIGIRGVLAIDMLTFLSSALLLSQLPPLRSAGQTAGPARTFIGMAGDGFGYIARHQTVRAVAIGLFLVVAFAALRNVTLVFLAADVLKTDSRGYGLLASSYGIGMVLGPLGLIRWSSRFPPAWMLLVSLLLLAVGTFAVGLMSSFMLAMIFQGVSGVGNGLQNVANDTLIQRTVAPAMLGRVFGSVYTCASLAAALTYALGAPLLRMMSPQALFLLSGGGVFGAFLIMALILPRPIATSTAGSVGPPAPAAEGI